MAAASMFLYGKNSILERLRANPKSIRKIFLSTDFDAPNVLDLIKRSNIRAQRLSERELSRIKRADRLQGIVAEVEKFKYASFDELLEQAPATNLQLLFLDGINDPQNLGSIIRITACFGGFAVILPQNASCEVTDAVMHVASGGENYTPVAIVGSIRTALSKAKATGYWLVGTVVGGGENINNVLLPFPLCLVMGSEAKGIRPAVKQMLDIKVTLPMKGAPLSLNVAMATAVFCHEASRQKAKIGQQQP